MSHFVSFNFINKLKISNCKRFYSSYNQNLDSFKPFRFVSISNQFDIEALLSKDIYDP